MKRTIGRIGCLVAAMVTLAGCDAGTLTRPEARPTSGAATSDVTIVVPGDTLAPCPEVSIPELPCRRNLLDSGR
jgi:hypothetical protein